MAERLRSFDFTAQSEITTTRKRGRRRYPWAEWFDGDIWKITQGEDFDSSPLMMERVIRTRASNKNNRVTVTMRHLPAMNGEAPSIVLQRTDTVGPAERRKLEAKERRNAKKAAAEAAAQDTLAKAGIKPVKKVSKRPARKAPVVSVP
jgi:hypothetical protein